MIKRLFLLICLCMEISTLTMAQQFKHFKLGTNEFGWWHLKKIGRDWPKGTGFATKPNFVVVFNAIHSFPQKIKRELIKNKSIYITINLTSNGKLSCLYFGGNIEEGMPTLTEKQWLKIVQIIENIQIDLTELKILPDNDMWSQNPGLWKSFKDAEFKPHKLNYEWWTSYHLPLSKILSGEVYLDSNGRICSKKK